MLPDLGSGEIPCDRITPESRHPVWICTSFDIHDMASVEKNIALVDMYILNICIYSYRPAQHLLFTVFPETDQRFQGEDWMEFYLKSNHQLDKGQGPK